MSEAFGLVGKVAYVEVAAVNVATRPGRFSVFAHEKAPTSPVAAAFLDVEGAAVLLPLVGVPERLVLHVEQLFRRELATVHIASKVGKRFTSLALERLAFNAVKAGKSLSLTTNE